MKSALVGASLALVLAASGCAAPGAAPKVDPSISTQVLSEVPSDVQNRTLVDFGGAIHLVGWDLTPADGPAKPGSTLHLKLYWRSVKALSPGWKLFTHVLVADAPKPYAFDDEGKLRQKLTASDFVPGNVYVDEQDIVVPDTRARELTLAVGVGHEAVQEPNRPIAGLSGSRLEILSGLSDGHDRAIIARLATGVVPRQKSASRGERRGSPHDLRGHLPTRPRSLPVRHVPKEKP